MEHFMGNKMTEHNVDGVVFRTADRFSAAGGVIHGFSTRLGGISQGIWASMNLGMGRGDHPEHVRENYRRLFAALGAEGGPMAMNSQVHGVHIRRVDWAGSKTDPFEEKGFQGDGLITDLPGVALVVFTADCLPLLLYDPGKKVACALHAGWRGTVGGIAPLAVERMAGEYGCRREDILAAVGPGISRCHFETDGDVPLALRTALGPRAEACVDDHKNGKYHVDLKEANRLLLLGAGLKEVNITIDPDCTACHRDKYWSHRYTGGQRGSQTALIQLT